MFGEVPVTCYCCFTPISGDKSMAQVRLINNKLFYVGRFVREKIKIQPVCKSLVDLERVLLSYRTTMGHRVRCPFPCQVASSLAVSLFTMGLTPIIGWLHKFLGPLGFSCVAIYNIYILCTLLLVP
jgi:hypothetical protein